ncbi:MAG: FxsA family protein [Clostridiales bacterium]|nr:FxsA family protein [Clostridiales bacterium]MCF8023389.1 FxsA family protein [Clostridiales bacterium]
MIGRKILPIFIVVPLIEMIILIKIGQVLGALPTILLVLGLGFFGFFLVKYQGLYILFEVRNEISRGNLPGDTLLDGLIVFVGGILLITPGFITAAIGIIFMIPQFRQGIRKLIKNWLNKKINSGTFNISFRS